MVRIVFLLAVLVVSSLAAPGERVKRYYHDLGLGGYGGGGGGGGGGYGGYGSVGHGEPYGAHGVPVATQSFSKASASSSSISSGGSFAG